jgi:hypothetical protein
MFLHRPNKKEAALAAASEMAPKPMATTSGSERTSSP